MTETMTTKQAMTGARILPLLRLHVLRIKDHRQSDAMRGTTGQRRRP